MKQSKKKITYAEHKHKMEGDDCCKNRVENHVCKCKELNKKAGKDIYACNKCMPKFKKEKYHYYETYQMFRQKALAHGEVPEKDIFETWVRQLLKELK